MKLNKEEILFTITILQNVIELTNDKLSNNSTLILNDVIYKLRKQLKHLEDKEIQK